MRSNKLMHNILIIARNRVTSYHPDGDREFLNQFYRLASFLDIVGIEEENELIILLKNRYNGRKICSHQELMEWQREYEDQAPVA